MKHTYIIVTPLKPHFNIVKLGFTVVYIIFIISAQKHRLLVLVRTASAVLTSTHNLCFEQKYEKYENFSIYLNRRVFVMNSKDPEQMVVDLHRWFHPWNVLVLHFSFFWYFGEAVLPACGITCVSALIFYKPVNKFLNLA